MRCLISGVTRRAVLSGTGALLATILLISMTPPSIQAATAWTKRLDLIGIQSLIYIEETGRLVAGNSGGLVKVSADSGATWTDMSTGLPASPVNDLLYVDDPLRVPSLFAATDAGVYQFVDPFGVGLGREAGGTQAVPAGGSGWALFAPPGPTSGLKCLVLVNSKAPLDDDMLVLGTSSGVFRANLVTPVWTPAATSLPFRVNDMVQWHEMLVAGTSGRIYLSTDGGDTWSQSSSGLTVEVKSLGFDPTADPPVLFAGVAKGIYTSVNRGVSWQKAATPESLETNDILVDDGYPGSVYAAGARLGTQGVLQSADHGIGWRGIGSGLSAFTVLRATAKLGPDSRHIFLGEDGLGSGGVWEAELPALDSVDPPVALSEGDTVTLRGSGFGATQGSSDVVVTPGQSPSFVGAWSDTLIEFGAPAAFSNGMVAVATPSGMTNGLRFGKATIILQDRATGSERYSNDVMVHAIHPAVGIADSIRIYSSPDVTAWSLGPVGAWAAPSDTSTITFGGVTGTDTVSVRIELLSIAADGIGPHDSTSIIIDLEPPALDLAELRDLTTGLSTFSDSLWVRVIYSVPGADSVLLPSGGDGVLWERGPFQTWVPYRPDSSLILLDGEGLRTVGLEFKDRAGNMVGTDAGITVDLTPPVIGVVSLHDIDTGDSTVTDSLAVALVHTAMRADSVRLAGENLAGWSMDAGWTPADSLRWFAYADSSVVTFAGDGTGVARIFFKKAGAGYEVGPGTDSILVDTTPPLPPAFIYLADLESGDRLFTDSTTVLFHHAATEDRPLFQVRGVTADSMRVMPGGDVTAWSAATPGEWVALAGLDSSLVTLIAVSGVRTAVYELKDLAGNTATDSVSITLDLVPPALPDSLYLADLETLDRVRTDSTVVLFRHGGSDGDSMRVMPGGDVTAWSEAAPGEWAFLPGLTQSQVTFAAVSGPAAVSFEVKDRAGNVVAGSVGIEIDLVPPTPADTVYLADPDSGDRTRTGSITVVFRHSGSDADSMRVMPGGDVTAWSAAGTLGDWTPAAGLDSSMVTFAPVSGDAQVVYQLKDLVGHTLTDSVSILLDVDGPEFFVSLHLNPIFPSNLFLYVSPSESLAADPVLTANGSPLPAEVVPGVEPLLLRARDTVPEGGTVTYVVEGTDLVGNTGTTSVEVGAARIAAGERTVLPLPGGAGMLTVEADAAREGTVLLGRVGGTSDESEGPVLEILPGSASFEGGAELRAAVPPSLSSGHEAGDLSLWRRGETGWEELASSYTYDDAGGLWLVARVERLGRFRAAPGSGGTLPLVPTSFRLYASRPNPFTPQTTIAFDLPEEGRVTLDVYDVSGRRVARLLDGELRPAGRHEVLFRPRDERGASLPSGVYFSQLRWRDQSAVSKMIMIR